MEYDFHDYKTKGISEAKLKKWSAEVGWQNLVNKRGTTWRQLDPDRQAGVTTQSAAIALMKEKTSVIKRPLIEADGNVLALGFDADEYSRSLKKR